MTQFNTSRASEEALKTSSGTGVFLPRVSVSRPVKWAPAASDSATDSSHASVPSARLLQGKHPAHWLADNARAAHASHVLPNLTPVSSPTAGAVDTAASSVAGTQTHSDAMLGKAAEELSGSWSEQLAAAPEVGGWSIKRTGSAASSSSSCRQQVRSKAYMMQLLQQHQKLQQQMQHSQPDHRAQGPRMHQNHSFTSSSSMSPAVGSFDPAPPPPRSRPLPATAGNSTRQLPPGASAAATASIAVPASSSIQMQQRYSRRAMPGTSPDAVGGSFNAPSGMARNSSGRAERAAALATMMTGRAAQPGIWGPEQLPGPSSYGTGGLSSSLQQQVVQHVHTAPLPGAAVGREQLQFVQQAAMAAGSRVVDDLQLQQAACSDPHSDMLLSEVDAQLMQLLQLREQLESCAGSNPAVTSAAAAATAASAAGVSALQDAALTAAAMQEGLLTVGEHSFKAYDYNTAGLACMPLNATVQIPPPGMSTGDQLLLPSHLPAASDSGSLLQLHATASSVDDSAAQLAAMGLDAAGQGLHLQGTQHSDPCLALCRDVIPSGSYSDQQYIGSGSCLPSSGQGAVIEGRMSEVKQKMRQLTDIQTVQRQLQEELLALLQYITAINGNRNI